MESESVKRQLAVNSVILIFIGLQKHMGGFFVILCLHILNKVQT